MDFACIALYSDIYAIPSQKKGMNMFANLKLLRKYPWETGEVGQVSDSSNEAGY